MKISAIICEFNPFHNGHGYVISRAKEQNGCEMVICVMSGSFTQRGEICRTDKFLRAKHAISCGADAVIELPAPFAVAPAEIFARGAIKLIGTINADTTLVFGCEDCRKEAFIKAAEILTNESEKFKNELSYRLESGESYIKSYAAAYRECGGDENLLLAPNNILGVEYLKAVKKAGLDIDFAPVKRQGAGYNDEALCGKYSSASGIRANADNPAIKQALPECSYKDFTASTDNAKRFEQFAADRLFTCDKDDLKRVYGCTEGLENRLKNLASGHTFDEICELASGKRYSKSRIRRIITANALGLYTDETEKFFDATLPLKILAVKKESADELLPLLSVPVPPSPEAKKCAELTSRAYALWRHLSVPLIYENEREKMILV